MSSPKPRPLPRREPPAQYPPGAPLQRKVPPQIPQAYKPKPLPPNYKPTERKVVTIMVALPIFFVTSYYLYRRLVLGEKKKELIKLPELPELDN